LATTSFEQSGEYVQDIKFKNTSLRSIYLEIPGVMNPKLSPLSSSTADIPANTTIYFFYKDKRYSLLTVQPDMEKTLLVDELIARRKKELKLEKQ
jgi:hypothetical protein